jgi:hypothetical protein
MIAGTPLPIAEVIDTSPDPEWSGGNGYWKSIGAKIICVRATNDRLAGTWGLRTIIAGHWSAARGPGLAEKYLNMLNDRALGQP